MPSPPPLPKVGYTRCYWTILSPSLDFLYTDPVLSFHLEEQAPAIIGRNLLDFVHPDEKDSARNDLGAVINQRGLHGSVTRVRFCRLSSVRSLLGFKTPFSPAAFYESAFPDARKIVYDDKYMACEIVLNWAADHPDNDTAAGGVVLCFIHAAIDIDKVGDNDERQKTPWSNWCSTPCFTKEHIDALYHQMMRGSASASDFSNSHHTLPARSFQIVENTTERRALFSWPPNSYEDDFARMAKNVHIEMTGGARTGCQRRFQSREYLAGKQVESIFILHGAIIFACHTVRAPSSRLSPPIPQMPHPRPSEASYYTETSEFHLHQHTYYDAPHGYHQRYNNSSTSSSSRYPPPPPPISGIGSDWSGHDSGPHAYTPSSTSSPKDPHSHYSSSGVWDRRSTSPPPSTSYHHPIWSHHAHAHAQHHTPQPSPHATTTTPTTADEVPPPNRHRGSRAHGMGHVVGHTGSGRNVAGGSSGRLGGQPPVGVSRCASCKTNVSPEWRKGPSGKKELCNACGLRYARSRAKKEGQVPQKRRPPKEKSPLAQPARGPPSPAISASSSPALIIPAAQQPAALPSSSHYMAAHHLEHRQSSRRLTYDHRNDYDSSNGHHHHHHHHRYPYDSRNETPSPPPSTLRERLYGHSSIEDGYERDDSGNYGHGTYYSSSQHPVGMYHSQATTSQHPTTTTGNTLPRINSLSSGDEIISPVTALPPFGVMTRPLNSGGEETSSSSTSLLRGGMGAPASYSYERGAQISTTPTPSAIRHTDSHIPGKPPFITHS